MIPLPAIGGFFLQHWKLFALAALILAAYFKGRWDVQEHFNEYKALVTAVGQAQERWATSHRAAQKALTSRKDQAYEMDLARLRHDNAGLTGRLSERTTDTRFVPSVPATTPGGSAELSCFEGDQLDAGVQRSVGKLLAGLTGLFQKCAEAGLVGQVCAGWVLEQWKLEARPASP